MIDKWLNPRLFYITSITQHMPQHCPECGSEIIEDEILAETYCSKCGLIITASYDYVAGVHFILPQGRTIQ